MATANAQPRSSYENVELQIAQDAHELACYPSTYGDKIRFAQDVSAKLTRHVREAGPLFGRLCQMAETVKRLDRSGDRNGAEKEVKELIELADMFLYTPAPTVTVSEYHETPAQIQAAVAAGIARRAAESARDAAVKKLIVDRTAPGVKFIVDRTAPAVSFVKFVAAGFTSRLSRVVNFRRPRNPSFAVSKGFHSAQYRLVACPPDATCFILGEKYGVNVLEGQRCEIRKQDAATVTISPMDGYEVQLSCEEFAQRFDVVEVQSVTE